MEYGICNLSIVPLRAEPTDLSEMVNQLLYGEHFKVLEKRRNWSYIRLAFDGYEGWVDNKQYLNIPLEKYTEVDTKPLQLSSDLVDFVSCGENQLLSICLGSSLRAAPILNHS